MSYVQTDDVIKAFLVAVQTEKRRVPISSPPLAPSKSANHKRGPHTHSVHIPSLGENKSLGVFSFSFSLSSCSLLCSACPQA